MFSNLFSFVLFEYVSTLILKMGVCVCVCKWGAPKTCWVILISPLNKYGWSYTPHLGKLVCLKMVYSNSMAQSSDSPSIGYFGDTPFLDLQNFRQCWSYPLKLFPLSCYIIKILREIRIFGWFNPQISYNTFEAVILHLE